MRPPTRRGLTPSHEAIDDQDDKQHAANAASDHGSAVIETAAATKQKQQDDDDQDNVHVSSGLSLPLLGWVASTTFNFRKLGLAANASLVPGFESPQHFAPCHARKIPIEKDQVGQTTEREPSSRPTSRARVLPWKAD